MNRFSADIRLRVFLPAILALVAALAACGTDDGPGSGSDGDDSRFVIESTATFSSANLKSLGWKEQKDFVLEYPESIEAKWGFLNTKELGILVYPSAEVAKVQGLQAAKEQTATGEDGQAVGVIDRISCRDAQGQSAVKHRESGGAERDSTVVHVSFQSRPSGDTIEPRVCSNQFPTYTEFRILGNVVLLCEGEGRTGNDPSKNCRDLPDQLQGN